jgi:hypothetical protein
MERLYINKQQKSIKCNQFNRSKKRFRLLMMATNGRNCFLLVINWLVCSDVCLLFIHSSMALLTLLGPGRNPIHAVGGTPWTGDQPVARPIPTHRTTQTQNKRSQTSMSRVGFQPTTPAFERAKTVHAWDRTAPVTSCKDKKLKFTRIIKNEFRERGFELHQKTLQQFFPNYTRVNQ